MAFVNAMILSLLMLCFVAEGHDSMVYESVVTMIHRETHPDFIPRPSGYEPLNLTIGLTLINIHSADPNTNSVELDAWLVLQWNSGLNFEFYARSTNLTTVTLSSSKVWRPDIAVYNGDLVLDKNEITDKVVIQSNGDIYWIPKSKIRVICDVAAVGHGGHSTPNHTASGTASPDSVHNITTCTIKIGSWTHSSKDIRLLKDPRFNDLSDYEEASRFHLLNAHTEIETKRYACCLEFYETLEFSFTFHKK